MRRVFVLGVLFILLTGCAGWEITDSSTNQVMAYASGKGMGLAINTIIPDVDADLGVAWNKMMDAHAGADLMPADALLGFYNECIGIISLHTADPYGLIQDMGVLLTVYGADFDDQGNMIGIQPVPMSIMQFFEMGYDNGRMVAEN
jgi:hypothetical protein